MARKSPTTIAEYIEDAPAAGHSHLHRLYEILRSVAPDAEEAIKWNTPFFVEPRFVFAFSAHKAHLSFSPNQTTMKDFARDLEGHPTTKNYLKIPYKDAFPEDLVRRMAVHSLQMVKERKDESFW